MTVDDISIDKMKGDVFAIAVNQNENADLIPLGAEFNVYDKDHKLIGFVGVHRGIVAFCSINPPKNLYTSDYTFELKEK